MFGGRGLYLEARYFGVIFDGKLYFRTDDESRDGYLSRGMSALQPKFRPRGPRTVDRNFEVPADILAEAGLLADAGLLKEWALRAARAPR
jgi:DNA transformation protein